MSLILQSERAVTLVGGGTCTRADLAEALSLAPVLAAADGGADRLLDLGQMPDAVIGDMDSISARAKAAIPAQRLHQISEQDSTDFDKALRNIEAPFVLALGMMGPRADHMLAGLNVLHRQAERPCLMVSDTDVAFLAPDAVELNLPAGARVSLFPLGPVQGRSRGLRWPIDGLTFTPAGRIGTSNQATDGPVALEFDARHMLIILERANLVAATQALTRR